MDIEQKAERARALLNDEILAEAFHMVQQSATHALTNCKPSDADGLQQAAMELHAVNRVIAALQAHVDTYTIEQKKGRHRG